MRRVAAVAGREVSPTASLGRPDGSTGTGESDQGSPSADRAWLLDASGEAADDPRHAQRWEQEGVVETDLRPPQRGGDSLWLPRTRWEPFRVVDEYPRGEREGGAAFGTDSQRKP